MIETLERIGELDDTLIFVTSDNGASGEGGLAGSLGSLIRLSNLLLLYLACNLLGLLHLPVRLAREFARRRHAWLRPRRR